MIIGKYTRKTSAPKIHFKINYPRLDMIALKVIREKDDKLWNEFILKNYPQFTIAKKTKPQTLNEKFPVELKKIYNNGQKHLVDAQHKFTKWWLPIEKNWFLFLKELFELNDIAENTVFTAHIGISPISPRDISNESFLLPFYANRRNLLKLCAHETSHFYFYRKIKEINLPNRKKFSKKSSYYPWFISEILVPLILNDPKVIDILGPTSKDSYICKRSLIKKYHSLYMKRSRGKINFLDFFNEICSVKIKSNELNHKIFKND